MVRQVALSWLGPVNFLTGLGVPGPDQTDDMIQLAKPGIYLWVYPESVYGKTGIYVGKSKNLIKRHFQHLGWQLNGLYNWVDPYTRQILPVPDAKSNDVDQHIIKSWEEARNCKTYFAPLASEDMALYAERAFIEAFQALKDEAENSYFYDQGVQQTLASKDPLVFENHGAQFAAKIFGKSVKWPGLKEGA